MVNSPNKILFIDLVTTDMYFEIQEWYFQLATRIVVSNVHKNTKKSFSETMKDMYSHISERSVQKAPLVVDDVYEIIMKIQGKVVERPQHMLMRVAVGIHKHDIDYVIKNYHLTSQRWFTHASPIIFNARTPRPHLSNCFLVCMKDDSIEGIHDTFKECAVISKST